jgi:hypothetical protein
VLAFTLEGPEIRPLYRTQDGPGLDLEASQRKVTEFAKGHLQRAEEIISGWEHGEGAG